MNSLDWPALMRAGLGELRLRPSDFWNLTPVEFLALAGYVGVAAPTTRETLERLSSAFPDQRKRK